MESGSALKSVPLQLIFSGIMKHRFFAFLALTLFTLSACTKDSDKSSPATGSFDRKAMLTFYADDFIRPAFSGLQVDVAALKNATDAFADAPDLGTLNAAKTAWTIAYSRFMQANAFNFGPAGEEGIRKGLIEEMGTWPVNEAAIENNINSGNTALADFARDNRGFHAVEYMLWSDSATTVSAFQNSPKRSVYIKAVVAKMVQQSADVATAWNGPYRDAFIAAAGTDVGSSTSQLYNEAVRSYEALKNFGLAVPLGNRAGQATTAPEKVEAYYSGQSLRFYQLHFTALRNFWAGTSPAGKTGSGFRSYLQSVSGGPALVEQTEKQAGVIQSAFDAIPQSPALSMQIRNGATGPLQALSTELQKGTRYDKSDKSRLLGIAITFSSGDGD